MIQYHVEMEDLTRIEAALGMMKDKSKMVLRTAINNAAKQTEDRMVSEAKGRYRYKNGRKGDIREANDIKKAKVSSLSATITATGPVNELLDFHVKPSTYFPGSKGAPKWIKARALRESKLQNIALFPSAAGDKYKAFVIKYKSGHLALAQRVPGQRMKSKPHKEAVKSLLSIATPKMEEVVYKTEIDHDMYDILQRNIQEQIIRYLG